MRTIAPLPSTMRAFAVTPLLLLSLAIPMVAPEAGAQQKKAPPLARASGLPSRQFGEGVGKRVSGMNSKFYQRSPFKYQKHIQYVPSASINELYPTAGTTTKTELYKSQPYYKNSLTSSLYPSDKPETEKTGYPDAPAYKNNSAVSSGSYIKTGSRIIKPPAQLIKPKPLISSKMPMPKKAVTAPAQKPFSLLRPPISSRIKTGG
jgi:hypothetical protein